jgi:RimJ/RimL family protein N-acetyltransferase
MITGKRVRLRAIRKEDLPQFVAWLNDPEVIRNLTIYAPMSLEQEEQWYRETLAQPIDAQPLGIEIKTGQAWNLIGNIGFLNIDQRVHSAEIGIFIGDKSTWDKGYGTEAMQLMLAYGFNTLNLNRIYLRVYETNPRGIRCYEKAGFQQEGRQRQAYFLEGKYIDVLLMSILKSDWTNKHTKEGLA